MPSLRALLFSRQVLPAALGALGKRPRPQARSLLLADPIYADEPKMDSRCPEQCQGLLKPEERGFVKSPESPKSPKSPEQRLPILLALRAFRSVPIRLRDTRQEQDRYASLLTASGFFKPSTLSGRNATKARLWDLLGQATPWSLQLMTHGMRGGLAGGHVLLGSPVKGPGDRPAFGSFFENDGRLFSWEVMAAPLGLQGTELVSLAACHSGHGKLMSGEGMLGLLHPFLARGATRLLVSRWSMLDKVAAWLGPRVLGLALGKMPMDQALREARAELRALGGAYFHPYAWAALTLWGAHGPLALPEGAAWLGNARVNELVPSARSALAGAARVPVRGRSPERA